MCIYTSRTGFYSLYVARVLLVHVYIGRHNGALTGKQCHYSLLRWRRPHLILLCFSSETTFLHSGKYYVDKYNTVTWRGREIERELEGERKRERRERERKILHDNGM